MKKFKAESKRLLDMMINSVYTHKEIFLRELISNASDAIDKRHFAALTDTALGLPQKEYKIEVVADPAARTLTVRDNGIGMSKEQLEDNLGVIAKSGSLEFKAQNEGAKEVDIIGQFGVGFYSAFMVSSEVLVRSKAAGSAEAHCWQSSGAEGYTVQACDKEEVGTEVVLTLKEDTKEEDYSQFLEQSRLAAIVRKYSDYIRYPIVMEMEQSRKKEGAENEWEVVKEPTTLNSMVPLWKRPKKSVKPEEMHQFYKERFGDWEDPLSVIQTSTEGAATYTALLFIPAKAPFDYYTRSFEKGLSLYASGVLIMEKSPDLLPDYFSFVKGLVDSQDLSLNISREMLQHDHQLKLIRSSLEKKIKAELEKLLKNDREKYETFWKAFGLQLKAGTYSDYGAHKEMLVDLLLFPSARDEKLRTFAEYVKEMPAEQKYIYYATGETAARVKKLPQVQRVLHKGYDVLALTDDVDEFMVSTLGKVQDKELRSVYAPDLGFESEEEKKDLAARAEQSKDLLAAMEKALLGKVKKVRLSANLSDHPAALTAEGPLSIEMEKVLSAMPGAKESGQKVEAEKVLELNAEHPVFEKLTAALGDEAKLGKYADLLYNTARLVEGLPLEDPVAFAAAVAELF